MPCYFLKVTNFLGKIFQFEVLVLTEENDFAYKLCLPINISDFYVKIATSRLPLWKKVPLSFPATPF